MLNHIIKFKTRDEEITTSSRKKEKKYVQSLEKLNTIYLSTSNTCS